MLNVRFQKERQKAPPEGGAFCKYSSMVSFETSRGDDPEEIFRSQGFHLSFDRDRQVAVLLADPEAKDFIEV
jgi:hypothetical protein